MSIQNMEKQNLVSVIIPTFNRCDFLKEAVDSVLKQSYRPIEVIIVDDGSEDSSYELIKPCLTNSPAGIICRYFYQRNNGVSSARNIGLKQALGEYIGFLDSDDLWDPRKLEIQMAFMDSQSEYQVCYTDEIWIRKGIRVNPKNVHQKYSGDIYSNCLPLCIISPSSILMKRDVIDQVGLFDEDLPACEDYDYWLRLSSQYPVYLIKEKLITKRGGHKDQLSHQYPVMDRFRVMALIKMLRLKELAKRDHQNTIRMIKQKCEIIITGAQKRGKNEEAEYYQQIIQEYCSTHFEAPY